jgi:hypothetical protein
VDLAQDLTDDQISKMAARPDMILQYAHYLKRKLQQGGLDKPIITANAWASLNGRPFQQLVDPAVNMAEIQPALFVSAPWILPLKERLSQPREPILYSLAVVTMLLANLGLAWSIYGAVTSIREVRMEFALNAPGFDEGAATAQSLAPDPEQFLGLVKILSSFLPHLAILLSLAAWVITRQPLYLGVALAAALLAAGWGLYLPAFLAWRFDHAFLRWGLVLLGILTGLFLFMQIIIIGPA